MVATSFTAEDQDIVIVDAAYTDLETALQTQVNNIRSDYPGYDEQKKAHTSFILQLEKLQSDYRTSGSNIAVIVRANKIVIDWLIKHISNMDKKIGEYAKNRG